jgi:hypothetical protein
VAGERAVIASMPHGPRGCLGLGLETLANSPHSAFLAERDLECRHVCHMHGAGWRRDVGGGREKGADTCQLQERGVWPEAAATMTDA